MKLPHNDKQARPIDSDFANEILATPKPRFFKVIVNDAIKRRQACPELHMHLRSLR